MDAFLVLKVMKKLMLFLLLSFSVVTFAQYNLTNEHGDTIEDGNVYTFDELGDELGIFVSNTSDSNIFTRIIVEEINNNSAGENLQLCYGGSCYGNIVEGGNYPLNNPLVIPPRGNNGNFDHIVNNYAGDDTTQPVEYVLKFVLLDPTNDLAIIEGSEVTFTFRYVGNLSTNNLSNVADRKLLKNSIVSDNMSMNNAESGVLTIYGMNGSIVKTVKVSTNESLNMSGLRKGNYIAVFEADNGDRITQKFIKK